MQVIITKKHCEQSSGYSSNTNCPLCVALKEQYPQLDLHHVGGDYVRNKDWSVKLKFDATPLVGWDCIAAERLASGEISEYVLDIPYPEYDAKAQQPKEEYFGKVKEIIRYVAVPETISESIPETIFN